MRALYFLFSLAATIFLFAHDGWSQFVRCRTAESLKEFRQNNPRAETDEQFEAWMRAKIEARGQGNQRLQAFYIIPVIFHIVHDGEAVGTGSNLSAAQIQQQLDQLNADFANVSGSTYGVSADIEIQFCLATVDAGGTPLAEAGIDRIDRNVEGWNAPPYDGFPANSYVDATIMPNSIWDPTKFYNIWTLELNGGLLGKATFPASSTIADLPPVSNDDATHSGVFIDHRSVGNLCVPGSFGSSAGLGRTLTHETGHFFGLRHIWGDASCGNDFCNDTPVQRDETSGCPSSVASQFLQNCPNPGDGTQRMFENYMDYTDDACVNTFTADQKARMQTVMLNSPRRMELPAAGSCTGAPANSIRFNYVCSNINEAGTGSCPRYRDISVNVVVFSSASGNATVTFNRSGTATDNKDYTVIPSSLSFVNGDNLPKTVTIRVWDDVESEGNETIVLDFNISGTGVVAGTGNQTFTLTVDDNDGVPFVNPAGSVVFLDEDFEGLGGALPAGWSIINADPGNQWVVSGNGGAGITGDAAHITNDPINKPLDYDDLDATITLLATPAITVPAGHTNLGLSLNFKVEGEFDAFNLYDYGQLYLSTDGGFNYGPLFDASGSPVLFFGEPTATTAFIPLSTSLTGSTFRLGFAWFNDNNTAGDPPLVIDDVVVSSVTTTLETTQGDQGTENVFNSQDAFILSADQELVTRIQNASAPIGCLTATVTQSGTGLVNVMTSFGNYPRSEKVIQITPATPNAAVTYTATLYFSDAEIQSWINALYDPNLLKILKVRDGVDLSSAILSSANSELITPVSVTNTGSGYWGYEGNFTGFSQFMLVAPNIILPVELLAFDAKAVNKSIQLSWSTSQELNNKGFGVERSIDGNTFENIGWVDGNLTTNSRSDYRFTDHFVQPGRIYYYRLRQTDIDNREKLSVTRQARIEESGILLTVTPNPARGLVKVFLSGAQQPVDINLVNLQGQLLRQWKGVNASSAPYALDISGIATGAYLLQVQLPDRKLVEKIMIR